MTPPSFGQHPGIDTAYLLALVIASGSIIAVFFVLGVMSGV